MVLKGFPLAVDKVERWTGEAETPGIGAGFPRKDYGHTSFLERLPSILFPTKLFTEKIVGCRTSLWFLT